MNKVILLLLSTCISYTGIPQNVGIGTTNPQQKLHVAGNIRVDALSGTNGVLKYNTNGDLVPLANSGNVNDALLGNGTWGSLNGTVPSGTIVATENYNDPVLISKGFALYGSLPGYTKYSNSTFTANPNTWAVTYYKGNVAKYSPPPFDINDLIVWADTVLYVFANNSLYAYNPVSDTWRFVFYNSSGYSASYASKAVWTGSEILVYGGNYTSSANNGFRYNPGADTWTAIPTLNQPSARNNFAMQLINNHLVVWGGLAPDYTTLVNTGAVLDLTTNTWATMSTTNAPSARFDFCAVGTSTNKLIVWGGRISSSSQNATGDGAVFDVSSNSWTTMATSGAPVGRFGYSAVWTGTEMILFGGSLGIAGSAYLNSGGKYNPTTNTWTTTSTTGAPSGRLHSSALWTGTEMLICGGISGGYTNPVGTPYASDSYMYNPSTDSWVYRGIMGVSKSGHLSINAGTMVLVFGGGTSVLNPITNAYTFYGGYPQGSRYFLSATPTSQTQIFNLSDLYLYIKQ